MKFLSDILTFRGGLIIFSVYLIAWVLLAIFVRSEKIKKIAQNALIYHVLGIGSLLMIMPFYWMVATSFKSFTEATAFPPTLLPREDKNFVKKDGDTIEVYKLFDKTAPKGKFALIFAKDFPEAKFDALPSYMKKTSQSSAWITEQGLKDKIFYEEEANLISEKVISFKVKNYKEAWQAPSSVEYGWPRKPLTFTRYFYVSLLTGILTTIGTLITSALAAYAFAKMKFFGKGAFFYIILMTMMVPGQVLLIPDYVILQHLGWLDKMESLIIPWLASVFCIFLMRQFFMTIPDDLWDAAQIDGSGRFMYLCRVMLPLSKPVMITSGIFSFLGNWNSLLWPLIVTSRPEMRTLMVGLQMFNQEAGSDFHLLMAASSLAILPIVILFFFLQRFFIQGIARSGLKS